MISLSWIPWALGASFFFTPSLLYIHISCCQGCNRTLSTFPWLISPGAGIKCFHESRLLPAFVLHVRIRVEVCGFALRGRTVSLLDRFIIITVNSLYLFSCEPPFGLENLPSRW